MSKLSEATGQDWNIESVIPLNMATWYTDFGKDSGDEPVTSESGQQASSMATETYEQTRPMREEMIRRGEQFMGLDDGKGFDPTASPVYQPSRMALERQYQQANELARQQMPSGGALNEAMAGNIRARASGLTGIEGQIAQDEYNKAYGLATGVPALSMSTLSNLAGSELSAAATQSAAKSGLFGDLGSGLGEMFGSK